MSHVRIFLRGGLGNQFFQWLHATRLAQQHTGIEIVLDTSFLQPRRDNQAAGKLELGTLFSDIGHRVVRFDWARRFEPVLSRATRMLGMADTDENTRRHRPPCAKPLPFHYGYYQTPDEFTVTVAQYARSLVKPALRVRPLTEYYAALHIRSGDYNASDYNRHVIGSLTDDYYVAAAAALLQHAPDLRIVVVSDDAVAAARLLPVIAKSTGATRIDTLDGLLGRDNRPAEALHYLLNARILATANSSFSAMAAYVGAATHVIAPQPWFRGSALSGMDPSLIAWSRVRATFRS